MSGRQTIKTLADEIRRRWPELRVEVTRGYCNTDRKPRGCRYITRKGRGRWGSHLRVYDVDGVKLLDHNNAETYRTTRDVVRWIADRTLQK